LKTLGERASRSNLRLTDIPRRSSLVPPAGSPWAPPTPREARVESSMARLRSVGGAPHERPLAHRQAPPALPHRLFPRAWPIYLPRERWSPPEDYTRSFELVPRLEAVTAREPVDAGWRVETSAGVHESRIWSSPAGTTPFRTGRRRGARRFGGTIPQRRVQELRAIPRQALVVG
jgi:hypothetical protein